MTIRVPLQGCVYQNSILAMYPNLNSYINILKCRLRTIKGMKQEFIVHFWPSPGGFYVSLSIMMRYGECKTSLIRGDRIIITTI